MKNILFIAGIIAVITMTSCSNKSKPAPESRTYETGYNSSSTATNSVEDDPFINNSLSTGKVVYSCMGTRGDQSSISVKTSDASNCDVVVLIKNNGKLVRNAYIVAGDSYSFDLPNGTFQVFFYGGRGWNPNKMMPNGEKGGFVANESYSKDEPISLDYQGLEYELIPQPNGNFKTKQSSASEIF
ncbi:hypothetical protein [uncultured Bacteroides sp.]|uniref:hypothetical protein n=1 Tax=uncultured Bacteroides sp. TaxID=162156 RepID=UPI002634DC22|nr:hypothetical protein [uncultured Bacteroides sp.]